MSGKNKYYKLVFRKLPERGYSEADFQADLSSMYQALGIPSSAVYYMHFISGKASKRRGPISSTGFITVGDESVALKIVKYLSSASFVAPSKTNPVVDIDNPSPATQLYYRQAEVSLALYSKGFKLKERPDKLQDTYEESEDFKAFLVELEKPPEKLPSAETLLDKIQEKDPSEDPKNTPMLIYLRKMGEKRQAEKREARLPKGGADTSNPSKKPSKKEKERKEKKPSEPSESNPKKRRPRPPKSASGDLTASTSQAKGQATSEGVAGSADARSAGRGSQRGRGGGRGGPRGRGAGRGSAPESAVAVAPTPRLLLRKPDAESK